MLYKILKLNTFVIYLSILIFSLITITILNDSKRPNDGIIYKQNFYHLYYSFILSLLKKCLLNIS